MIITAKTNVNFKIGDHNTSAELEVSLVEGDFSGINVFVFKTGEFQFEIDQDDLNYITRSLIAANDIASEIL